MTKREARALYTPKPDGGAAARRLIDFWNSETVPKSVFCFVSEAKECDTAPILRFCLERNIPLSVPLCEGRGLMTARTVPDLSVLRRGLYGLWEPPEDAPLMEEPEWVVVPGLAFDREGFRLGRGGGYYDRWLSAKTCRTVGLCHPERLLERVPRNQWDMPVEMVITGVETCHRKVR